MEQVKREEAAPPAYRLYAASALGAFMLGFGDLLNNGKTATVLKVSEMVKTTLYPPLENGGVMALIGLVLLGAAMCWVFRPLTLADAFARGFSIYAVLAVAAPYQPAASLDNPGSKGSETGVFFLISPAYAQPVTSDAAGRLNITIEPPKNKTIKQATVTIRDPKSGEAVGSGVVDGNSFSIRQPKGSYVLEIEAAGFRRSVVEVTVDEKGRTVSVPIEESSMPMAIQRLYAPEAVEKKAESVVRQ